MADPTSHEADARSLGSLIRLQAAIVKVNCQPTQSIPRWRVLRRPAVALAQPKASSVRFRMTVSGGLTAPFAGGVER